EAESVVHRSLLLDVGRGKPIVPDASRKNSASPKQTTGSRVCSCRESRGEPMPDNRSERSDLLQGTLDVLILKTLSAQAMHGWGIAQRIQQLSDDVLAVNQGSLYPALHRLGGQGWDRAERGRPRQNTHA